MLRSHLGVALGDIAKATKRLPLVGMLGWQDVRQRYRRSSLGPFWLTISMGVMIGTIGLVFGKIFNSPMAEFLPFLAVGMIIWAFVSSVINEGCTVFVSAEGIIKQLPIPLFTHVLRMMWRNILVLGHNIVILPLVFLSVGKPLSLIAVLSVFGLILAIVNLTWMALLLGIFCARFRDLSQIVASVLQVLYFLTPIIWMPSQISSRSGLNFLDLNPAFHLMEIIRAPLLGTLPTEANWLASIALGIFGWLVALLVYNRYKRRIAYWV